MFSSLWKTGGQNDFHPVQRMRDQSLQRAEDQPPGWGTRLCRGWSCQFLGTRRRFLKEDGRSVPEGCAGPAPKEDWGSVPDLGSTEDGGLVSKKYGDPAYKEEERPTPEEYGGPAHKQKVGDQLRRNMEARSKEDGGPVPEEDGGPDPVVSVPYQLSLLIYSDYRA